jgi:hypothetical protein
MIIVFDKDVDKNITDIYTTDTSVDATKVFWSSLGSSVWVIDEKNFKIMICTDSVTITFNSKDALEPYITQRKLLAPNWIYPTIKYNTDPYYDLPKTGVIEHHVYKNTDVEADLKKNML